MKLLYFASIRQGIGTGAEDIDVPSQVRTVGALIDWLIARGEPYSIVLADRTRVKAAVNETHAGLDAPIGADDCVAFFPPVTGG